MKPTINFDIYITNDPFETIDILANDDSPLRLEFKDRSIHFYEPRIWENRKIDPLITFKPPMDRSELSEWYKEVEEIKDYKQFPQSEFDFVCYDIFMADNELVLFKQIVEHLINSKQEMTIIGQPSLEEDHVYVGANFPMERRIHVVDEYKELFPNF